MADIKLTLVVACALVDADKRVLIAQRPEGKALAGLWEFPGGKIEAGERPEQTLIRELHEEIGITVSEACLAPLTFASHAYDDFSSVDAALHLPALGRRGDRARGTKPCLGPRQQTARLPDAAGGHSADPASDRSVDVNLILRSRACATSRRMAAVESWFERSKPAHAGGSY